MKEMFNPRGLTPGAPRHSVLFSLGQAYIDTNNMEYRWYKMQADLMYLALWVDQH